jgi:hypothetical protein
MKFKISKKWAMKAAKLEDGCESVEAGTGFNLSHLHRVLMAAEDEGSTVDGVGAVIALPDKCATCPYRKGGLEHLRPVLQLRAHLMGTPLCHSTGPTAITSKRKTRSPHHFACRGARDAQIKFFHKMGFLAEPTDACYHARLVEVGSLTENELQVAQERAKAAKK